MDKTAREIGEKMQALTLAKSVTSRISSYGHVSAFACV